ncbi:MAG: membrane protein insertase YidC [Acidobacteriales bacterium]|nr:membrane protein insertase YidC [Terriglobales bacterium]
MLFFGALVIIVLLLADFFYRPPKPPPATEQHPAAAQSTPATAAAKPSEPATPAPAAKQASAEEEIVIENDLYRITFTNRGGHVKSWILKQYQDDHQKPLDLVNPFAAPTVGFPLSLWTYDEGLRKKLSDALYAADVQGRSAGNVYSAPATITFEYADQQTQIRKQFKFDHSYVIEVEASARNNGGSVQAYPAWPGGFGDQTVKGSYLLNHVSYQSPDKVKHLDSGKVSGGATLPGPFYWAGTSDQYFGALFMPRNPPPSAMVTLHGSISIPRDRNKPDAKEADQVPVLGAAVGDTSGLTRERLYVGPKSLEVLKSVRTEGGTDLTGAVDFGFFGIFARWLFLALKWIHHTLHVNWGWAIAVATILINLAVLPLRIKSMQTSLKMQRIQPQMEEIKKKYEKYSMRDPRKQEMQKEIWELQRSEGVNMLGGCLPMLPQIPLLYAFYVVLVSAIELRHAGWLWIKDLSSPDPFHILPLLTVVTMMGLQHITPTAGLDPAQRRMMNIMMPIMFGWFTWTVASGLALYWTIGNVVFFVQQYVMNHTKLGREIREMQEKRARKKNK